MYLQLYTLCCSMSLYCLLHKIFQCLSGLANDRPIPLVFFILVHSTNICWSDFSLLVNNTQHSPFKRGEAYFSRVSEGSPRSVCSKAETWWQKGTLEQSSIFPKSWEVLLGKNTKLHGVRNQIQTQSTACVCHTSTLRNLSPSQVDNQSKQSVNIINKYAKNSENRSLDL